MFNDHPVQSRVDQFKIRNGNDAILIRGWWVFSNGAMREQNPYGALRDPPTNPFELWKVKVQYYEEKLRRATVEFDEWKRYLEGAAYGASQHGSAPPTEPQVAKLRELQAKVQERLADLNVARDSLEQNTPSHRRERLAAKAANQQEAEKVLSEIKSIKV